MQTPDPRARGGGVAGEPDSVAAGRKPAGVAAAAGWCFVLCTAAAVAYGWWSVHGSGRVLASFDVMRPDASDHGFGPLQMTPEMNPLRVILRAGHAPVGSRRIRYTVSVTGENRPPVWKVQGALGSTNDEASIVWTNLSLGLFGVPRPGSYFLDVRFGDGSMDDLLEATLEVRRNAVPADPVRLWSLVGVAGLSLIVGLATRRRYSRTMRLDRAA